MTARIETLPDGVEALVITTGTVIEIHPLAAIAAYSELLGEPDATATVVLIRQLHQRTVPIEWAPLYGDLGNALADLVDADVPEEEWADTLKGGTGKARVDMRNRQRQVREKIVGEAPAPQPGKPGTAEFAGLLTARAGKIKEHRTAFLREVAPEGKRVKPPKMGPAPLTRKAAVGRPTISTGEGENGEVG